MDGFNPESCINFYASIGGAPWLHGLTLENGWLTAGQTWVPKWGEEASTRSLDILGISEGHLPTPIWGHGPYLGCSNLVVTYVTCSNWLILAIVYDSLENLEICGYQQLYIIISLTYVDIFSPAGIQSSRLGTSRIIGMVPRQAGQLEIHSLQWGHCWEYQQTQQPMVIEAISRDEWGHQLGGFPG